MSKLVTRVLGEEAWLRMVSNAPAAWDDPTCNMHMCTRMHMTHNPIPNQVSAHVHVHVPITLSLTR